LTPVAVTIDTLCLILPIEYYFASKIRKRINYWLWYLLRGNIVAI